MRRNKTFLREVTLFDDFILIKTKRRNVDIIINALLITEELLIKAKIKISFVNNVDDTFDWEKNCMVEKNRYLGSLPR